MVFYFLHFLLLLQVYVCPLVPGAKQNKTNEQLHSAKKHLNTQTGSVVLSNMSGACTAHETYTLITDHTVSNYTFTMQVLLREVREVLLDSIEQARIQGVSVGVLLCFSLSESIGMNRGALLPLDSVTRIQSSKFWMMECDTWADLLIICQWANPTTTFRYCVNCSKDTKTIVTSCEHHICLLCAAKELNRSGSCPKCSKKVTAVYLDVIVKGRKRELSVGCIQCS